MQDALNFLLLSENVAFSIAGLAVLIILAFEIMAMLIGGSLHLVDADMDFDLDKGEIGTALDWINPGHVPLIILLTIFLSSMALCGWTIQWSLQAMDLPLLHWMVATPIAVVVALPIVRGATNLFNRFIPKETTNAVSLDSLIGFYGTITLGPVTDAMMGQAKFKDDHGTTHYLDVFAEKGSVADRGADVVLLGRFREEATIYVVRQI